MKTKIVEKTFWVYERDESGLIPDGVSQVRVYYKNNQPEDVWFIPDEKYGRTSDRINRTRAEVIQIVNILETSLSD
ncbi:MAG: hypothetical protein Q7S06_02180 [Nanoarchaeota archaeon]|nr:hypothetical protein [Nanoarchaeota archaeon]